MQYSLIKYVAHNSLSIKSAANEYLLNFVWGDFLVSSRTMCHGGVIVETEGLDLLSQTILDRDVVCYNFVVEVVNKLINVDEEIVDGVT